MLFSFVVKFLEQKTVFVSGTHCDVICELVFNLRFYIAYAI